MNGDFQCSHCGVWVYHADFCVKECASGMLHTCKTKPETTKPSFAKERTVKPSVDNSRMSPEPTGCGKPSFQTVARERERGSRHGLFQKESHMVSERIPTAILIEIAQEHLKECQVSFPNTTREQALAILYGISPAPSRKKR